mgnify:CR=1 FL=1
MQTIWVGTRKGLFVVKKDGGGWSLGKPASSLGFLNRPVTIGTVDIRKITIVAIVVASLSATGN